MSETTLPTFTDEEIDDMPRADLQKYLKEREEPANGTNGQLAERLKAWCAAQVIVDDADDDADDGDEEDDTGDGDGDDTGDGGDDEDASSDAPPVVTPEEVATQSPARHGGPRRSSFGKTLSRAEPDAQNFVDACKTATLVRLHSTHIVQRINIPYGVAGRARAVALYGIDLKGYINEELATTD